MLYQFFQMSSEGKEIMVEATLTVLKLTLDHQMEMRNLSSTYAMTKGVWAHHCLTWRAKMPSELAIICLFLSYQLTWYNKICTWAEALTEMQCPANKTKSLCGCFHSFSHSLNCMSCFKTDEMWWNMFCKYSRLTSLWGKKLNYKSLSSEAEQTWTYALIFAADYN